MFSAKIRILFQEMLLERNCGSFAFFFFSPAFLNFNDERYVKVI